MGIYWWYDGVSVKTYTSFQDLFHNHFSGWVFAIFRKSPQLELATIIHTNFAASQTPTENLDDFPVSTLPRDPPNIENITSATITKSSTVAVYAICFCVETLCLLWLELFASTVVDYHEYHICPNTCIFGDAVALLWVLKNFLTQTSWN